MISLIDAGPGTGKTYSLIYGYLTLSQQLVSRIEPTEEQAVIFDYLKSEFNKHSSVCFFAHGRQVKDKLERSLKSTRAKVHTLHGAGYSVLLKRFGYQKKVNYRTEKHIKLITGKSTQEMSWSEKRAWAAVKRIVHYLKIEAAEPTDKTLSYLKLKYPDLCTYSIPESWAEDAADLLEKAAIPDGLVEFGDMPWLAKKHIRGPIYDLGFVDESQDVSNCTFQLLTRMCKNIIFCGDRNQAINAFAGASEEMYDKIKSRSDAVLPLKMTQRCTPDICNIANQVRPGGIMPGPNREKSIIKDIEKGDLTSLLVGTTNPANTLFLSRTNAAVVNLAIYLHTKGIPFTIIDKDLATEIDNFIKSFKASTVADLRNKLNTWLTKVEKYGSEFYIHSCKDKYNYVNSILTQCPTLAAVKDFLKEAFNDNINGFKLTSVHKAKGMEAQNIFIIDPPIPLSFAQSHPIAWEQELNLDFVAKTRSSLNMYYVR